MRIEPLTGGVFRVEVGRGDSPPVVQESVSVIDTPEVGPASFRVEQQPEEILVIAKNVTLALNKETGAIRLEDAQGPPFLSGLRFYWKASQEGGLKIILPAHAPQTSFYGLGEKTGPLDKLGQRYALWNTDASGYDASTDPLYQSHPFFIMLDEESKATGFFLDISSPSKFDFAQTDETSVQIATLEQAVRFYLIPGPFMKDVVRRYTALTGRIPMPPVWAIGHMISKLGWNPAKEIPEVAERARKERIPTDALWLDLYYMDSYKSFTWNNATFKDLPGFLGSLHSQGYRAVGIIHPAIKLDPGYWVYQEGLRRDAFVRYADGSVYLGRLWPGTSVWPDFTRQDVREWWGSLYGPLVEAGMDGFWNDMNEPSVFDPHSFNNACKTFPSGVVFYDNGRYSPHITLHNAYGMLMAKASYEGIQRLMPNKRPFLLSRAGLPGIQRYAAVWTGDNASSFAHLNLQNPMLLNMGLSGLAFSGADVGGFAGSVTPELLVRWYEAATFMPLMREHADQFALPQEPWAFGEPYTSIIRKHIELRYALLPYLYSLFYEAHTTGSPILRPLVMEYQDDPSVRNLSNEFLVGEYLLVAPVLEPGVIGRSVYLPKGRWYSLNSKEYHLGGQWTFSPGPLDRLPIFVKEGAVLSMVEPGANTIGLFEKPIRLDIYPLLGASSRAVSRLVLDDGTSLQTKRQILQFTQKAHTSGFVLDIERSGDWLYKHPYFEARVYGEAPFSVIVDGKACSTSPIESGWSFSLPSGASRVEIVYGSNFR
jgi:alpha-glucosidase